jgi:hypothetical protein
VERYAHSEPTSEARQAALLPTPNVAVSAPGKKVG